MTKLEFRNNIKEAIREAVTDWVRDKSGFDEKDPFFNMLTFRASREFFRKAR